MSSDNQTPAPQARNAIRHGLTAGQLPGGAAYVARITAQLRVAIEDAVLERRGKVTLTEAATIQTVLRWERHALLCQRWMRVCPGLTPDQLLAFSRDAARASSERDRCLKTLHLDADATQSIIDRLYRKRSTPPQSLPAIAQESLP